MPYCVPLRLSMIADQPVSSANSNCYICIHLSPSEGAERLFCLYSILVHRHFAIGLRHAKHKSNSPITYLYLYLSVDELVKPSF